MAIFSFVVALVTIVSTVLVSSTEGQSAREGKQIFVIPYGPSADSGPQQYYPHQEYEPNPYYYNPSVMTRQGSLPSGEHNPRFFFGGLQSIQNLFNGFKLPGCPTCPTCPNQSCNCPAIPGPATLTIADATAAACQTFATMTSCVRSSLAPSGTVSVTFPANAAGQAVATIAAQAPNTKVRVICPTIPGSVTVRTQSATMAPNTAQEETGFAALVISSTNGVTPGAVLTCTWTSS